MHIQECDTEHHTVCTCEFGSYEEGIVSEYKSPRSEMTISRKAKNQYKANAKTASKLKN